MLQELEEFAYETSLDLNMGYYTIRLNTDDQKLCTITPLDKYQNLTLPMAISWLPHIFQENMTDLMQHLNFQRKYRDDLLVISCSTFENHLEKLECVLKIFYDKGLRVNAEQSTFCADEIEYLGYWISKSGIHQIPEKVEAIKNMVHPTTRNYFFIGMVNYYCDMWVSRSELIAPLTSMIQLDG
jgi:hypothetical protein